MRLFTAQLHARIAPPLGCKLPSISLHLSLQKSAVSVPCEMEDTDVASMSVIELSLWLKDNGIPDAFCEAFEGTRCTSRTMYLENGFVNVLLELPVNASLTYN